MRLFLPSWAAIVAVIVSLGHGGPAPEPVLRRATDRIPSLDPAQAASVSASRAVALIYETLLSFHPDPDPYRLMPGLAVAVPDPEPDGKTYVFRLSPQAAFAPDPCFGPGPGDAVQGRPVTAQDVVYSLKRLADVRVASPGAWTVADRIEGMAAFREWSRTTAGGLPEPEIPGLQALDNANVRIRLVRSEPEALWVFAMPYTSVVPREAVETYGRHFDEQPVGSGPYRLESWRRNYQLTLVRNRAWPGWRLQSTGGTGRPFERHQWRVIDDPITRWMAFLAGELDVQLNLGREPWEAAVDPTGKLIPALTQRRIRLHTFDALDTAYIGFNFDDPVLGANPALRQALQSAFDADEWERFHLYRVRPAAGPVPPGIPDRLAEPPRFPFDLANARRLLDAAGYPGGIDPATGRPLELTLDVGRTDSETRETTELLAAFFARINVDLQPRYHHWPAFLARVSRRESQMFRLTWVADLPDAENFLQLFYSPNASPGPNRVNFNQPEYDRLFEAARAEENPSRRREQRLELQRRLLEACPWIWLHHRRSADLSHAHVAGIQPHAFPYGMEKHWRARTATPPPPPRRRRAATVPPRPRTGPEQPVADATGRQ